MVKEIWKENVNLICPHCSRSIENVWICEHQTGLEKHFIYFCSECEKLIGISHERNFSRELLKSSQSKSESSSYHFQNH
jgi:DNA-directed RNA polymerase subunit RPC12/RpoP